MKFKLNFRTQMLLMFMLLTWTFASAMNIAQEGGGIEDYVGSMQGMVALTLLVSNQVKDWLNIVGQPAQILAWVMGMILVLLARYVVKIGFIMEYDSVLAVLGQGLGVVLVANGIFDIEVVQKILNALSFSKNKHKVIE